MVAADTGRVIYVSDSVTPVLNQTQSEWFGSTLYEQVHPDDVDKLREQLSTSENSMTGKRGNDSSASVHLRKNQHTVTLTCIPGPSRCVPSWFLTMSTFSDPLSPHQRATVTYWFPREGDAASLRSLNVFKSPASQCDSQAPAKHSKYPAGPCNPKSILTSVQSRDRWYINIHRLWSLNGNSPGNLLASGTKVVCFGGWTAHCFSWWRPAWFFFLSC